MNDWLKEKARREAREEYITLALDILKLTVICLSGVTLLTLFVEAVQ
jgi:hypothetical protein